MGKKKRTRYCAMKKSRLLIVAGMEKLRMCHEKLCKEQVLHADETTLQVLKEAGRPSTSKAARSEDPWQRCGNLK